MAAMSVARAMAGSGARSRLYRPTNSAARWAASVALPPLPNNQHFVSVAKGRGDQLCDLHDAIGMLVRELLLDGRAFGKRTEYTFFHGKRF